MGSKNNNNNNNNKNNNKNDDGDGDHEDVSPLDVEEVKQRLGEMNIPDGVLQSALVEAMRNGLEKLVGTSSGYLESLPAPVRARINYLESVQADYDAAEDALNEEIKALERKYKPVFDKLLVLRKKVIAGEESVPEEFAVVDDGEEKEAAEEENEQQQQQEEEDVNGIPDFWLVAMCNHPMFDEMITEKDAEILSFLEDVSCEDILDETGDEEGYKLTFSFRENDFFSNKELSLVIELFQSGGMMQVDRLEGTEIQWKSDSVNPTIKMMKKKAKSGKAKKPASSFKKEKVDSFFNVFSPPEPEELEDMDDADAEEMQEVVEKILAMGETLREEIIPHAIHWFTGEAAEEEDDSEDESDGEDSEEEGDDYSSDDDEDEDDDDEDAPSLKPVDAQNPECKQQ